MFFLAVVGAPVLRQVEPPELRAELFRRLGERFRLVGWWAIGVLLLTGVLNLQLRGMLRWELLGSPGFWTAPYGRTLAWKLAAVTVMLVLQGVHDFALGPAASRLAPGSSEMLEARRRAALLARASALVGLLVIAAAVRLARGG
jgi:putative copper export protein